MEKIEAIVMCELGRELSQPPSDLTRDAVVEISSALRVLLADAFALYIKTKNFHWHMSGVHFRDHHLLLDEQADQIFAMTDDIAERARKIGGNTIRSIGDIARHQRIRDNDEPEVGPRDMLEELCVDSRHMTGCLRSTHDLCERYTDVATASFIETWIDQTERRSWFLFESARSLKAS